MQKRSICTDRKDTASEILEDVFPPFFWLVVSTHLKNISQNGNLPQIGVKKKYLKPPPSFFVPRRLQVGLVWLVGFFFGRKDETKMKKQKKGGGRSVHKT